MTILTWADLFARRPPFDLPVRLTIGVFDGVHVGHRRLLSEITSADDGTLSLVMTFSRSPVVVHSPDTFPGSILTYQQKLERIGRLGVQAAVVIDFSGEMSNLSGEAFVRLLRKNLTIQRIVVGQNFRFGKKRISGTDDLKEMLSDTGTEVLVTEPVLQGGIMVSSSRIRTAILSGDLGEAREMLAADHAVDLRGIERQCSAGTIRVSRKDIIQVLPPEGQYAVALEGPSGTRPGKCVIDQGSLTLAAESTNDVHATTVVFK
jgi:riboflavin kinase/FMN adenylyltransferase